MRHSTARNTVNSDADAALAAAGGIAGHSGNGFTGFNSAPVTCPAATPTNVASTGFITVKKSGKFLVMFEASGTAGSGFTSGAMSVTQTIGAGGPTSVLLGTAEGPAGDDAGGVATGIVATGAAIGQTVNFTGIMDAIGGSLTVPGSGTEAGAQGKVTALEI